MIMINAAERLQCRACDPGESESCIRAIEAENRAVTFVAATEGGVPTPYGPEILRMSGARLARYRKNSVVLDGHYQGSATNIIGSAEVKIQGKELIARVSFSRATPRAEQLWTLVDEGHLRAVSVGWRPSNPKRIVRLAAGETDGEGPDQVTGPAVVVREWELVEISLVPVGADEDALRRNFYGGLFVEETKEEEATVVETTTTQTSDENAEEVCVRAEQARRDMILAIAPQSLRVLAECLVLRGVTVDEARAELLKAHEARLTPVGTPEPKVMAGTGERLRSISDDEFLTALCGG